MLLSEIKNGTPVKISACKDGAAAAEVWGRIRRTARGDSLLDVYYYKGSTINLNSPEYEIHAVILDREETPIEWCRPSSKASPDTNAFQEKRDAFRIYISEVANAMIGNHEVPAFIIDMGELGFRIAVREQRSVTKDTPVTLEITDENDHFTVTGKVVWSRKPDDIRTEYGCILSDAQDRAPIMRYIQKKQEALLEQLKRSCME